MPGVLPHKKYYIMSKFKCTCGNVISDTVYPSKTEAWLYTEEDGEIFETEIEERFYEFLKSVLDGKRQEYIEKYFDTQYYPADIKDNEVISDSLTQLLRKYTMSICECENCGRIHVQKKPGINEYISFSPDSPKYEGILKGKLR
jgi:type III secretory pathway component EscR